MGFEAALGLLIISLTLFTIFWLLRATSDHGGGGHGDMPPIPPRPPPYPSPPPIVVQPVQPPQPPKPPPIISRRVRARFTSMSRSVRNARDDKKLNEMEAYCDQIMGMLKNYESKVDEYHKEVQLFVDKLRSKK